MQILRRDLLRGAALAAVAGGAAVVLSRRADGQTSFGPLLSDPDGVLELPEGFTYTVLQTEGDPMSDGLRTPGRPDGMACFTGADGNWVLMRNHELSGGASPVPSHAYNELAEGGVSRLVIRPDTLEVLSSNLILTGTLRNCAGGPSEWGWLSCEETDFKLTPHGFVFLCRTDADTTQPPERITAYGRFKHEAVAIDPATRIAYLTEDEGTSAFYRMVPHAFDKPFNGQLQALAMVERSQFDTSEGLEVGDTFEVSWVDIDDPLAQEIPTAEQAHSRGAAIFRRGEGIWYDAGSVYFTCTSGGPARSGQIFRLDLEADGGTLTLVAQATGDGVLKAPDNLTVSPWGDLLVCEDFPFGDNYVRGITQEGAVYDFARNRLDQGASEFAGACFSPNGRVMFVNLQVPGLTLAIQGPFPTPRQGCFL